jgi:hypothetical protein
MRLGKTAILGLLLAAAPSISGMAQEAAPFYRGKTIRIVISTGVAGGYAGNKEVRFDSLKVSQSLDRPVMLPPGVPAGRVEELRQAFDATVADEAFRADVERTNLHVDPVRGEDMASALGRAFALPAEVIAGARAMMGDR